MTVVPPSLPVKHRPEFIAYAKANPGKLNFGFGQGTAPQLVGEWLKRSKVLDIASVPYRGGMQAIDRHGGRHASISTSARRRRSFRSSREGKVRAHLRLATRALPELPDVPTMIESGFPGLSLFFWSGLWAPAGTPAEIVSKLNAETNAALRSPEMKAAMERLGIEANIWTQREFAAFIADETPKWENIVRRAA